MLLGRVAYIAWVRPIATHVARTVICVFVSLAVCWYAVFPYRLFKTVGAATRKKTKKNIAEHKAALATQLMIIDRCSRDVDHGVDGPKRLRLTPTLLFD